MMREDQADQIIDLLGDLLEEMRGMRTDFMEFTGYNVYKMSTAIEDIGDRVTGGAAGIGGSDLADVAHRIEMVELSLPSS